MKRCLEIFLIMRYLHVPSQEHESAGGEGGCRGRLNRFANALQYALCLEPPCEGREVGIRWLDLLWPSQWTTKKTKQKRAKWRKNARGGKWGTSNGKRGGGRKGKGTTLCKFCVLTTNPKTQLPPKNRHTRALS